MNTLQLEHNKRLRSSDRAPFWFVSREFDFLFVIGLAPWIMGLVAYALTSGETATAGSRYSQQIFTTIFVAASLIVGESHQFTSIIRYFKKFRKPSKRTWIHHVPLWIMFLLVGQITAMSLVPGAEKLLAWSSPFWMIVLQFATLIFPSLLFHHVCAQTIAILQIYCQNSGYQLDKKEKCWLSIFMWCLVGMGTYSFANPFTVVTFGNPESSNTGLLVPFTASSVTCVALLLLAVFHRGATTNQWPPMAAVLLWTNLCLFSFLPQVWDRALYVWLFVPLIFHATQHWAVAWSTQKREAARAGQSSTAPGIAQELTNLGALVLATTMVVLFLPALLEKFPALIIPPFFRSMLSGQTLNVFLSMFVFYMHYFSDRIIWQKTEEGK